MIGTATVLVSEIVTSAAFSAQLQVMGQGLGVAGSVQVYAVRLRVYFGSQAHAEQALAAFRARGVNGAVAELRTYCGD